MRTILLTGAAGFIGARTVEFLLKQKKTKVVGVDSLNDYYDVSLKRLRLKNLKGHRRFHFSQTNIEHKGALKRLFQKHRFDAVINLAARAGVRYSVLHPHVYFTTNAEGNLNLLELMRAFKVKKYVMASTSSLYAGSPMPFLETLDVSTPISPYAASKKAAEATAYTYHYLYGIDVSILRYFTVYGPAGRPDMSPFRFIEWIQRGEPIQLFGDGRQKRDFTYVDDIARGTMKALKRLSFEIINLGNNKPYSINQMIRMMEEGLGKKAIVEKLPVEKTDMKHTWANIQKAKRVLNWKPQIRFEEGLKKTIQWHIEQAKFLKKIHL